MTSPRTLFDKIWGTHEVIPAGPDHPAVIYVDTHLIHEVTSPQAFSLLRDRGLAVRRPDRTWATVDHSIPTRFIAGKPAFLNQATRNQVATLEQNCEEHGIELFRMGDPGQGIVHVIGPELGLTQPGQTIVCGDSHTSTHGAFGAWAFGIGTTEVAQVLATQCLLQERPRTLGIEISGRLAAGVAAKDLILGLIRRFGVAAGRGHVIEYCGAAIRALDMEGRMTVCNMSIEGGARAGMIAPDEKTFEYLKERKYAPQGTNWEEALAHWRTLATDADATYDRVIEIDAATLVPHVTWGTNPGQVVPITGSVPNPEDMATPEEQATAERALTYMGLEGGTPIQDISIDRVFLGSCTNARLEDLRAAAGIVRGKRVHPNVRAMVVPGSTMLKKKAESEGLNEVFQAAGFEWREAGCSMCLGMNPDILAPGERCASTSNRNFEGRQGKGGRTHLVSPQMAAAAAIAGRFVDVREW
jgi:3-isopropylmalate/(R)-2-methylmalate dehydratase large subunit